MYIEWPIQQEYGVALRLSTLDGGILPFTVVGVEPDELTILVRLIAFGEGTILL